MADNKSTEEKVSIDDLESIFLELEDGSSIECYVVGVFDHEDVDYIGLVEKEDEVVLLYKYIEYQENPLEFGLERIEDDEEFDQVSKEFFNIFLDMGPDYELENE